MKKNLLFIGGPVEAVPALGRAKALGYNVFVVDGKPDAPGMRWALDYGAGWHTASTYNPHDILEVAYSWPLDGIISVACDVGPVVSYVAMHLQLPHIPYEVASLSWNKQQFLHCLRMAGVPTVQHASRVEDEVVIIKPVDGRGGRGVHRFVWGDRNTLRYLEAAKAASPSQTIMLEHFSPGPQISTESIVYDSRVIFTGLTDRDYSHIDLSSPYIVERGGYGPSRFEGRPEGVEVKGLVEQLVRLLGLVNGTIKCDVVLDQERGRAIIIEAAIGRLSGGFMCSHYLPIAYGIDFLAAAFAVATGQSPEPLIPFNRWQPRPVRGYYEMNGATSHPERGKFKLSLKGGVNEES